MTPRLDPVTLEVIRNVLPAVANEMAADLQRTSYNMMIYEVRDFCAALVDKKGRLISQNVGGVSHFVADLGIIIEDAVRRYGVDGFAPGDVLITNHQRVAGQHLNNIVIFVPFFFEGRLICFSMVRAHWIDVGGMSTGFGAGPNARDPWLEGLQLDQLKIYKAGVLDEQLHRVIKDNIRFPESSLGDMRSQIAACRLAVRQLEELFAKYGLETMMAAIDHIFAETEERCRKVVGEIPDGVYEAESFYDDDSIVIGEPVRIHAKVVVDGGHMTIDLSGCSQYRKGSINARTLAAARVAYKALTEPMEAVNEGSFSALKVVIPEGNIMMAPFPAPMASWSLIVPTVVDTIFKALAPAMKNGIAAGHHALLGGSIVFFGAYPDTGKNFVLQSLEGGGWGGRPFEDGESGSVTICQGDVRNAAIEAIELKFPVMVEKRGLRPDSGGPGKYRGGLGIEMRIRNFIEGRWNLPRPRRQKCPPWGMWGGRAGGVASFLLKRPNETEFCAVDSIMQAVPPETQVIAETGGGGGWGNPLERDASAVRWDVIEGLVSREAAERDYGVVLNPDFSTDQAATARLRREMATGTKHEHFT
jgi:N-methylhydantoinase B